MIQGSGGSGSNFGGKKAGQGKEIDLGQAGSVVGSGSSGGSFGNTAGNNTSDYSDNSRDGRSQGGNRRGEETALGALEEIAPIPPEPLVFEAGSTFYRGQVTFTIEILDPSDDASTEGEG